MTRTDDKIMLVNIKLSMNDCKKISKKEIESLSDTARDFLCFVQSFGNKLKVRDFVNLWLMEDQTQDLNSVTCGIFQICLDNNLFNPTVKRKIQSKEKLPKAIVELLLNELFILNHQNKNKNIVRQNEQEQNIMVT